MDARSIAATAANGGVLTPATDLPEDTWDEACEYTFDDAPYKKRVYWGFGKAEPADELVEGPNIKPWPAMEPLGDDILLKVCSKIMDPVTTTDELIPSGETSSFRSNPLGLAEFTLSRRDPATWVAPRRSTLWRSVALPASPRATWRRSMPSLPVCLRRWPARVSRPMPSGPEFGPMI